MARSSEGTAELAMTYDERVLRLTPALLDLLARVLRDRSEAEDVLQETFLRLVDDPVGDRPEVEVAAWLRRVGLNLAFNRLRDTRRWHERAERGGRLSLAGGGGAGPLDDVLRTEEQEAVRRSLARLPEKQRACLLLRHTGYSYAEIAASLGVPVGSVGTTLARAERAFRTIHEEHDDELS